MGEARRRFLARIHALRTGARMQNEQADLITPREDGPSRARTDSLVPPTIRDAQLVDPEHAELATQVQGANRWIVYFPDGHHETFDDPAMAVGRVSLDVPIDPATQLQMVQGLAAGFSGRYARDGHPERWILQSARDVTGPVR